MRKRRARRRTVARRTPILAEAVGNARWSLDFVHDQFACERRFRILNAADDVTREYLQRFPKPRFPVAALAEGNAINSPFHRARQAMQNGFCVPRQTT